MAYNVQQITAADKNVKRDVERELNKIAGDLNAIGNSLPTEITNVEPSRPNLGTMVYADGTNWNPGSGAGFYIRGTTSWLLLVADV